ncbi:MAG TPA: glucose-6-phosphate dehydrogenase, partial [Acidimicrobiales bacterium]
MVVFGASGDLCRGKLMPALARLAARGELPSGFAVVGIARTEWDDDEFRQFARESTSSLGPERGDGDPAWRDVVSGFRYVAGEYDRDDTFRELAKVLEDVDRTQGTDGNRLYYLAVPPLVVPTVIAALGRHRLAYPPPARRGTFTRIVIEKPYGTDIRSAQELDHSVHEVFDESQVYRIDHFLGKETVQNLLAVRFANAVFEPIWNRRYVDSVQITVAESVGVGHRAAFFEEVGTLRDMVQNHVMQILALTLMEPPITIAADGIRDEKVKALRAVEIPDRRHVPDEVVRGQSTDGWVAGQQVPGYRQEPGVGPSSTRETYVALRLLVDNWRWAGVPFYLRTGKRLPKRVSEVAIQFHDPPHLPFGPDQTRGLKPDALVLRIHPDDGIALIFGTKVPGHGFHVRSVAMEFLYEAAFPGERPEAYERLLLDAMVGDPTLFIRTDEVMQAWRMMDPILDAWERDDPPLAFYRAGSWGPVEADDLLRRDGRSWRNP